MPSIPYHFAFAKSQCEDWPSLENDKSIPANIKSKHNTKSEGNLGLGMVHAVTALLVGAVRIGRNGDDFSIVYQSSSENGGERTASSVAHPASANPPYRIWHGTNAMQAPTILCILESMLLEKTSAGCSTDELSEVRERWMELIAELEVETMEETPYSPEQIREASESRLCQRAMKALCDAVYFSTKRMGDLDERQYEGDGGTEYPTLPKEDTADLFDRQPEPQSEALPAGYLSRTLGGLIATGGTCLLVGPTGTFKTTTATRAADEAGAALQVVKGRPGIEDRDFFGGVVPTENGPAWVDGPVTKAFRSGRSEPTMLLMDELLRFEPLFLGAFVGLLDPASPAELSARGIDPAPGCENEQHYVAELPSGDQVACPTSRLTLVATTNMGRDYVQATDLDAALMGRFELTVEVEKPDPDVKRMLYERAGGRKVADLLEAVEEIVEENHVDDGGLYVRKAHPRLMLNMASHMDRILATEGLATSKDVAAREAAGMTVVPNCVQREANGLLDPAGKTTLLEKVEEAAADLL